MVIIFSKYRPLLYPINIYPVKFLEFSWFVSKTLFQWLQHRAGDLRYFGYSFLIIDHAILI